MTLRTRVKRVLREANISQIKLAELAGVSHGTVNNLVNGKVKRTSAKAHYGIARALDQLELGSDVISAPVATAGESDMPGIDKFASSVWCSLGKQDKRAVLDLMLDVALAE